MNHEAQSSPSPTLHVRIEGDLMFVRVTGSMTLADFKHIAQLNGQLKRQHGIFFALYDASRMDGIDSAARKALKSSPEITQALPAVTAVFGASFLVQTLGNMIDRALIVLGRRNAGRRFFESEALARAYIQQERLRLKSG